MSSSRKPVTFTVACLTGIVSTYLTFQGIHAYIAWQFPGSNPPFAANLTLGVLAAIAGLWVTAMASGIPAFVARKRGEIEERNATIDKGVEYLRSAPLGTPRWQSRH